ncbi:hypothetical protein COCSUDRAFT_32222 [Coccomyxa subellipsoidea C-169]|uniref:Uncharacterized protein n=1 Tax=Coccomyxa subellipsoidea (strain C-169) TaxID=574566 RepID=I0Z7H2_COCSC|nr:hypothetical protein COCSUDRAFT_32222 [Coccomyxa subellipsoidea C-169]EIE26591.1 hypothetical protein COCSUDRAFT_32222 [Coccomyxa subellipsoidea C-169]|eukprot:XP_005651135.1 hypothetical protein COCSUDRAFT_32222 [Coccomyxa subellipsoidea C-169]
MIDTFRASYLAICCQILLLVVSGFITRLVLVLLAEELEQIGLGLMLKVGQKSIWSYRRRTFFLTITFCSRGSSCIIGRHAVLGLQRQRCIPTNTRKYASAY